MNVVAILSSLLTVLASPGGQGALEKLFVEHGLTLDALDKVIAALPDAPEPMRDTVTIIPIAPVK